jgi:tripartite-type tricarboxylate transporter receptor subunit TctC
LLCATNSSQDVSMMICTAVRALVVAICGGLAVTPATAQEFYRGRTLTILVGFTPGGGFDVNARLLARHIGRHIPGNPSIVVQNMPGAAGLNSVQYLDTAAPKDGTVIDIFNFGNIGDSKLMPEKIKVDFRNFNWIGSISQDLTVCYVWHAFGPKTLAELKTRETVHMGLTAVGSSSDVNQRILKNIFGVRISHIAGYPGSAEERMAIERGELDGNCGAWSSIPAEWIETRKIVPIIRSAPVVPADLPPGVPYSAEIAPSERDRQIIRLLVASGQIGRPFIASSAVPAERVRILRAAFNATMRDPQFIAEADKLRLPVSPQSGEDALKIIDEIYATPDDIVQAARKIAGE